MKQRNPEVVFPSLLAWLITAQLALPEPPGLPTAPSGTLTAQLPSPAPRPAELCVSLMSCPLLSASPRSFRDLPLSA